jgi:hypothetical protein
MILNNRQIRKHRRCEKRRAQRALSSEDRELMPSLTKYQFKQYIKYGSWWDPIEQKQMQVCDYKGHCECPCNGDC